MENQEQYIESLLKESKFVVTAGEFEGGTFLHPKHVDSRDRFEILDEEQLADYDDKIVAIDQHNRKLVDEIVQAATMHKSGDGPQHEYEVSVFIEFHDPYPYRFGEVVTFIVPGVRAKGAPVYNLAGVVHDLKCCIKEFLEGIPREIDGTFAEESPLYGVGVEPDEPNGAVPIVKGWPDSE